MVLKSSRLIRHDICKQELQDLGAKVMDISDSMTYVVFNFEQTSIAYLYNVSPEDKFHFERAKPYTMEIGIYDTESEIVDAIKLDIEQFKMAMSSSNFDTFIKIDSMIANTVRTFEDLYLYYNINKENLATLSEGVNDLLNMIHNIKNQSDRVYFKSNPLSFSQKDKV